MMLFTAVFMFVLLAPIGAALWSVRAHQVMAPSVGALEVATPYRPSRTLAGRPAALRAVVPLALVEAKLLVSHPAPYLLGVPMGVLALSSHLYSAVTVLPRADIDAAILFVPYAWGTLVAANLNTLRSRRWRSEELQRCAPVPDRSRTAAHLLASLAMLPGTFVLLAVNAALGATGGRTIGAHRADILAVGPLLVVGAGCLGVAVARWLPRPLFGWVAVIVSMVLQVNFGYLDVRWRWLHFTPYGGESITYPQLAPDHHAIHLVYLLGGIALVAGVALARDGLDRRAGALLVAAAASMAVTGVVQVQPPSPDEVVALSRRLEQPGSVQTCATRGSVTYCAEPPFTELVEHWSRPVAGVIAKVPAGGMPSGLVVRQRPLIDARSELPTEIADAVDPGVVWPDDEEVSVSHQWAIDAPEDTRHPGRMQLALGFRVALRLVGLPPDAWWSTAAGSAGPWRAIPLAVAGDFGATPVPSPVQQCSAEGEARAVVAIWLAAQATPEARAALLGLRDTLTRWGMAEEPVTFDAVDTYRADLPSVLPEQGAVVGGRDVQAAAALLGRPDDEVAAVLAQRWEQLVAGAAGAPGAPGGGGPMSWEDARGWFGVDEIPAAVPVVAAGPPDGEHEEDRPRVPLVSHRCAMASGR